MKIPSLTVVLSATILVLVTIIGLVMIRQQHQQPAVPFLDEENSAASAPSTLFFHLPNTGINFSQYKPGAGKSPPEYRLEMRDKRIVQIIFDSGGAPDLINVFATPDKSNAPATLLDPLDKLTLIRQTRVAGSSMRILTDSHFNADQSIKVKSTQLPNHDLDVKTYRQGSRELQSDEVFDGKSGMVISATYWREDGSKESEIYRPQRQPIASPTTTATPTTTSTITTSTTTASPSPAQKQPQCQNQPVAASCYQTFPDAQVMRVSLAADGSMLSNTAWLRGGRVISAFYEASGTVLKRVFDYQYGRIRVFDFDAVSQKVTTITYFTGSEKGWPIVVQFFNEKDARAFTQEWMSAARLPAGTSQAAVHNGFYLVSVDESFAAGHNPKEYSLQFFPGSGIIRSANYVDADGSTRAYYYRADGSLDMTYLSKNNRNATHGRTKLPPGPNKRREPRLDKDLLKIPDLTPPTADLVKPPVLPVGSLRYRLQ